MSTANIDHFISGQVVAGSSGRTQDVFNPATGAVTGQGSGRTVSAGVRKQSFASTWTRIEDCGK